MSYSVVDFRQRQLVDCFLSSLSAKNLLDVANGNVSKMFDTSMFSAIKYDFNERTISESFVSIFEWMEKTYKNSYFYKYSIAKEILKDRHNKKTSVFFNEMCVGNSIADSVIINGHVSVYEIKSEFDDKRKLCGQIDSYKTISPKVWIVADEKNVGNYEDFAIENSVGLLLYENSKKKKHFVEYIEPVIDFSQLSITNMFNILRKNEYTKISQKIKGGKIVSNDFNHYSICLDICNSISSMEFYKIFKKTLKNRKIKCRERLLNDIFAPILPQSFAMNPNEKQTDNLQNWLERKL